MELFYISHQLAKIIENAYPLNLPNAPEARSFNPSFNPLNACIFGDNFF